MQFLMPNLLVLVLKWIVTILLKKKTNNNKKQNNSNKQINNNNITRLPYLHDTFPNVMEMQVPCPLQFANIPQSATSLQFAPANPG